MNSIEYHKQLQGKIEINSRAQIDSKKDLSNAYTPGVAEACREIETNPDSIYDLTRKKNTIAIITDGTAVLGMGNIGPEASLPVMEGKSVLLDRFGSVNAFPLPLDTTDPEEIIETTKNLAPMFGGIHLEDICAPRCFQIERTLKEELDMPVFHDDQHGTSIAALAGLYNAAKLKGKPISEMKIAIAGVGAAGSAVARLLLEEGVGELIMIDSIDILSSERDYDQLNFEKQELLEKTNKKDISGGLADATEGADAFIGVSVPNILSASMVENMVDNPIIFALANPDPEIDPELARQAGAEIIATGRSDYPNQINNALVFPGLFRGLLEYNISNVSDEVKIRSAKAIARQVDDLRTDKIIPDVFNEDIVPAIVEATQPE